VRRSRRAPHALAIGLAALPLAWLGVRAAGPGLGANPVEAISHVSGDWSLRLLLATLAVTPARQVLGLAWLAPLRRTLGLCAFAWVCLHLLTWLVLDQFLDPAAILEDLTKRRYIAVGFLGFVCLLPLAVTSTRGWMRRLGRRWVTLHRLVYVAAACGVVHYLWLAKADRLPPLAYAAVLALLLASRIGRLRLTAPDRPGARAPGGS
jgi:sulfoxide reductase heme-binding subunit YedZ